LGSGVDVLRIGANESMVIRIDDASNLGIIEFDVSATGGRKFNLLINDNVVAPLNNNGGNLTADTKYLLTFDASGLYTGQIIIKVENVGNGGATIGRISFAEKTAVNKNALGEAIEEAESKAEADYTSDSWAAADLANIIAAAQAVYENAAATQGDVDAQVALINEAIGKLVEAYTGPAAVLGTYNGGTFTEGQLNNVNPNEGFSFAIQVPAGSPLLTDLDATPSTGAERTIAITSFRYEPTGTGVTNFTNNEIRLTPAGNHIYVLENFDAVGANPLAAGLAGKLHTGYLVAETNGGSFWWDDNTVPPAGNYLEVGTFAVPTDVGINDGAAASAKVIGLTGAVLIENAEGATAVIANALGKAVFTGTLTSNAQTIAAPAGVTVVIVNGEAVKVLVK
jgi:hypothetical protein